ncbi:MAG: hypothetical protein WCH99_10535 [Verrucomicrobiota bacterium]
MKIEGKTFRESLKIGVISKAKLLLADFLKEKDSRLRGCSLEHFRSAPAL